MFNKVNKALSMMQSMVQILNDGIEEADSKIAVKNNKIKEIQHQKIVDESNKSQMENFLNNLTNTNDI